MSKKYKLIKLKFETPLHLSRGQTEDYDISDEIIHSDTLSSALFAVAMQIMPDKVINEPEKFFDSFRISSAFPFYCDEYFFPKPMLKLNIDISDKEKEKAPKLFKKLTYISKSVFEKLIAGEKVATKSAQYSENGKFLCSEQTGKDFMICKKQIHERVQISHNNEVDAKPYYIERMFFGENAGLFCMIDCENEQFYKDIVSCFRFLGEQGVGTDRNVGNGIFTIEETSIDFNLPEKANAWLNLSMYLPEKSECDEFADNKHSSWLIVKRGGYIAGSTNNEFISLRKKSVYMMREGGIICSKIIPSGKIVNLKPENKHTHNVWRSGRALFLPVKLNKNGEI